MQNSHATNETKVITLPATNALFRTILSNVLFEYAQVHQMTYVSIADIFHKVAGVSIDTAGRILNRVPNLRPDTLEKVTTGIGKLTTEPFICGILCQMVKNEIKQVVFSQQENDLVEKYCVSHIPFISDQRKYSFEHTYAQGTVSSLEHWDTIEKIRDLCKANDELTEHQALILDWFVVNKGTITHNQIAGFKQQYIDPMVPVDLKLINDTLAEYSPANIRFMISSSDAPGVMENHKTYTMKYGARFCTKKRIDE